MYKIFIGITLSISAFWMSCDCRLNNDCQSDDTLVVTYINSDSMPLLGASQYSSDSIRFTPLLSDPANPASAYLLGTAVNATDLYVRIDNNITGFIIQLDYLSPDTVLLTTTKTDDKCCGEVTSLDKVTLKNKTFESGNFTNLYIIK